MLPISRRHLLGLLTGFLTPTSRAGHSPEDSIAPDHGGKPFAFSTSCLDPDSNNPSALEVWRRLPILPLVDFKSFSAVAHSDGERFFGRKMYGHMVSQTDFEFRYLGGSDPGTTRRVHPILFFRKFETDHHHLAHPEIYLLAYCHARQQSRTFRLDRISTV